MGLVQCLEECIESILTMNKESISPKTVPFFCSDGVKVTFRVWSRVRNCENTSINRTLSSVSKAKIV